jgi:AraC-like DNA-binding protein
LSPRYEKENGFEAEQAVWNLNSLVFTRASMPGAGYQRTWRHLTKDPIDHWCLVLVPADESSGTPEQFGIRSLAHPFVGEGSDSEVLALFIPRDLFRDCAGSLDAASKDIPTTGLGGLLRDYMRALDHRLPAIMAAEVPNVVEATRALIAACIIPNADRLATAQGAIEAALLERAREIVRANLTSSSFGPDEFCKILGVSRSHLYRLFEPLGGVGRYIQRQRLLKAYSALSDSKNATPITKIAENLGFCDAAGFSRAFKREFGHSPSDTRITALGGLSAAPNSAPHSQAAFSDLGDLLRRIQA